MYLWEYLPNGLTTSKQTMLSYAVACDHCRAHMSITVYVFTHKDWDQPQTNPFWFQSEYPYDVHTLMMVMTMHSSCTTYVSYSLCFEMTVLNYELRVIMNHVDTSQCGSTSISEIHWVLTTHVLWCFIYVSVLTS